jgi:hypothetical protein
MLFTQGTPQFALVLCSAGRSGDTIKQELNLPDDMKVCLQLHER